jgi:hypothetical protein
MGRNMLVYHVAIPLAVFVGLLLFGVSFTTALFFGLMAGCVGMVVMMVSGGGHDDHRPPRQTTGTESRHDGGRR